MNYQIEVICLNCGAIEEIELPQGVRPAKSGCPVCGLGPISSYIQYKIAEAERQKFIYQLREGEL